MEESFDTYMKFKHLKEIAADFMSGKRDNVALVRSSVTMTAKFAYEVN